MKINKRVGKIFIATLLFALFSSLFVGKAVFAVQSGVVVSKVTEASTSYIDDDGYEQTLTDVTTEYKYASNGQKAYETVKRTRTYTDADGSTHTFSSFKYRNGEWGEEVEIKTTDNPEEGNTIEDGGGGEFTFTLLQALPKKGEDLKEGVKFDEYLRWAYRFTIALAGFLAVLMIVIGGVMYIASGANEKTRGEAKSRIESAIWGLIYILIAYLLLYTINPTLVDFSDNKFFSKNKDTSESQSEKDDEENDEKNNDNPYINKGESATKTEQKQNDENNNNVNDKFENPQGSTKNSQFQGTIKKVDEETKETTETEENTKQEPEEDTSDNPYLNRGESTTKTEQKTTENKFNNP
ncbi:hypothetical protein C4572_00310 [Candidatus Parcubacteria bacterium]|nr:MAG: hypothetical protein C4572_00310 [Candidatus Parcubacteria bacterium]